MRGNTTIEQEQHDNNFAYVISSLSGRMAGLKKDYQEETENLQAAHKNEIHKLKENHQIAIEVAEHQKMQELADLHFQFKNSLTWRIGSFFINLIKYLRNFVFNPIRFFANSAYRHNDVDSRPRKRTVLKPFVSAQKTLVVSQPKNITEIEKGKPVMLGIMDTFTYSCFKPEFNLLTPDPENWLDILNSYPVQALFIESAWHGNEDTWLYQIGKYNNENNKKLKELISNAKNRKLPIIFWNKEDPVHYEHFMVAAELADYVFTTDSDCIPGYQERVGHNNVFALPFAAQEKIHNPVRTSLRNGTVCFAGTYHAARYAERQNDMSYLLKPALEFGLEIYDRNYGAQGKAADNFRFPDIYQKSIKGKLEYHEMVQAYKNYKVFLNVNSVRNSPTMFSRRVFELLACGTPVISTYSKGIIDMLGSDTVFITESEEDTRKYLGKLLNDEEFWWKQSLRGMRMVLENHTYHHRANEMLRHTGITTLKTSDVSFLTISEITTPDDLVYLKEILNNQTFKHFDVLLVMKVEMISENVSTESLQSHFDGKRVKVITWDEIKASNEWMNYFNFSHLAIFDLQHYYGKNYLRDHALACKYAGAGIIGKKSHYSYSAINNLAWIHKGYEYVITADVLAASVVMAKNRLSGLHLSSLFVQDTFYDFDLNTLSIDPFNFIYNGRNTQPALRQKTEI